ncbi:MAG: acyl-CoA dehydrogenase family protein [Pseudomonadota bacterium]
MNFDIDAEDVAFRAEVRAFLREALPADMAERARRGFHPLREDTRAWTKILNRKGWAGANWPKSWGGPGWSPVRQFIFDEEAFMAGAPAVDTAGFKMIGPIIMTFGSEAMKAEYGPRILDGDVFWGQGFSEPNAGSDLGSLSTSAVRDGDDYVINGRKIWTSFVETADMIFVLVKTDPQARQRGISMLLVDKHAPGITIRPIIDIGEGYSLNEVFFDDVRTPATLLVGEEGKGWSYAKHLLDLERAFSAEWPRNKRNLEQLRAIAARTPCGEGRLIDSPGFAARLARLDVDLAALEWLTLRALYEKQGGNKLPVGSLLKVRGSELLQKIGEMQVEALGEQAAYLYAEPHDTPPAQMGWPPGPADAPGVVADYMYRRATTIYGGSNEVQRTIIARTFLEL